MRILGEDSCRARHAAAHYLHINVLEHPEIREAIKLYGNWPTIPQLYVPEAQNALSSLREEFEKYNDTVRKSRRDLADYLEEQKGLWEGLKAGWRDFTSNLANEFEIGREVARNFGTSTFEAINNPIEDFFLGKLKTFRDYWTSFLNDLSKNLSRAITQMIFEWTGLRTAMSGGAKSSGRQALGLS